MGIIARGSYGSTVQTGFFGRGDVDGFMRKTFNVSANDFACLLEDFACTATASTFSHHGFHCLTDIWLAVSTRKLPTNVMQATTVKMILEGLRTLLKTFCSNALVSYMFF